MLTSRGECLNHFVFLGLKHLDSVVRTYRDFYLHCRPHQGVENELLTQAKGEHSSAPELDTISLAEIRCEQRFGGLLKHYSRRAA